MGRIDKKTPRIYVAKFLVCLTTWETDGVILKKCEKLENMERGGSKIKTNIKIYEEGEWNERKEHVHERFSELGGRDWDRAARAV